MKKKIYFSISAILQIIILLIVILNAETLVNQSIEQVKEMYSAFPIEFQEEVIENLENSGVTMVIVQSAISIVLNLFVFITALENKVLVKKGKIIATSVVNFFLANNLILEALSISNFIVILCLKRKNPEDYPSKEKKKIPQIEYEEPTKREKIFGIIFASIYILQFLLGYIIPESVLDEVPTTIGIIITIGLYICLFILAILAFSTTLKKHFKLFKENAGTYIKYILPRLGIMYIIYIIASYACIFITRESTSVNQSLLEEMPMWFIVPSSIIWAPIVEELLFRGIVRRIIKNKIVYVICSALIFGLLHTVVEATLLNALIMMIPYAILGGFFAYIYTKTENLSNNILLHAFNNLIAVMLTIVL